MGGGAAGACALPPGEQRRPGVRGGIWPIPYGDQIRMTGSLERVGDEIEGMGAGGAIVMERGG